MDTSQWDMGSVREGSLSVHRHIVELVLCLDSSKSSGRSGLCVLLSYSRQLHPTTELLILTDDSGEIQETGSLSSVDGGTFHRN